ncbi:MAG: hypothetical protein EBQ78_00635 [Betaproteobacteria bacterium]|nr:hypothetical protein [Betaproteobacteria bacterium]
MYNPTKGWKVTERLINAFPDWHFEPLKGLNREQLSEKLYQAKLTLTLVIIPVEIGCRAKPPCTAVA